MNVPTRMGSWMGKASRPSRPKSVVIFVLVVVLVRHHLVHARRARLDAAVQDVVIKRVIHARVAARRFVLTGFGELPVVLAREGTVRGARVLDPFVEVL